MSEDSDAESGGEDADPDTPTFEGQTIYNSKDTEESGRSSDSDSEE